MNPLYFKFFKYLEDIGEQEAPLKIKLLYPNEYKITPEDLHIKGNFDLANTSITSLPDNLQISGDLDIGNTRITSLPSSLKVKGNILIYGTPLESKTEEEIRQMAPGIRGEIWT